MQTMYNRTVSPKSMPTIIYKLPFKQFTTKKGNKSNIQFYEEKKYSLLTEEPDSMFHNW